MLFISIDQSFAYSSKVKRAAAKAAIKGKPGANYSRANNSAKKISSNKRLSSIIAEMALIKKPQLVTKLEKHKKQIEKDLSSVDIDPAAKTLLSILPKKGDSEVPVIVSKDDPSILTRIITVRKNDSFIGIFNKIGYSRSEINKFMLLLDQQARFNIKNLKLGQRFIIKEKVNKNKPEFVSMQIPLGLEILKIVKENDTYKIYKDEKEIKSNFVYKGGKIQSTLINLAARKGIPNKVIARAVRVLSNRVDLGSQLRKGDKFEILYEQIYDTAGRLIDKGRVLYIAIDGKIVNTAAYRFTPDGNERNSEYFDKKGIAFKRSITNNPLHKKFRISSPFGYRKHPILKKRLMHTGTDFAAPTGTKIYAAGDGTISKIGRYGGYGNYIKIRHDSVWQTAYGHLSRFGKGMRKWKRVKKGDLIGYVGSTGRSTGPHLHYEIIKYGKPVNPMKVRLPSGKTLKGQLLNKMKDRAKEIDAIVALQK